MCPPDVYDVTQRQNDLSKRKITHKELLTFKPEDIVKWFNKLV